MIWDPHGRKLKMTTKNAKKFYLSRSKDIIEAIMLDVGDLHLSMDKRRKLCRCFIDEMKAAKFEDKQFVVCEWYNSVTESEYGDA